MWWPMADKSSKIAEDIKKTLEHAGDWETKRTPIPGIYLVRLPDKDLRVKIMFNPPDESGKPTRRKGWYFDDEETLIAARDAFNHPKISELLKAVARINSKGSKKPASDDDVFQF